MTAAPVTFQTSAGPVSIWQTGPDTATLVQDKSTYQLGSLRLNGVVLSGVILGYWFVRPKISLTLDKAKAEITIVADYKGTLGPYQLSPSDFAKLMQFIAEAQFPSGFVLLERPMMTSWKTTLGGAAAIVVALGDILTFAAQGQVSPHLQADVGAIITGVGLLLAKDHNVQ